jgi:hypothetical protein
MNKQFFLLGRVWANKDEISCITVDRDMKCNTYEIMINFKNGAIERAVTCETEQDVEDILTDLKKLLNNE